MAIQYRQTGVTYRDSIHNFSGNPQHPEYRQTGWTYRQPNKSYRGAQTFLVTASLAGTAATTSAVLLATPVDASLSAAASTSQIAYANRFSNATVSSVGSTLSLIVLMYPNPHVTLTATQVHNVTLTAGP